MKKSLMMVALLAGTFCAVAGDKEINLLCVGNSFNRNATKYLSDIVKTFPDCKLNLSIVYAGGTNLDYHWNRAEKSDKDPTVVYCTYNRKPIATFKPAEINDDEAKELRNLAHVTATTFVQPASKKVE